MLAINLGKQRKYLEEKIIQQSVIRRGETKHEAQKTIMNIFIVNLLKPALDLKLGLGFKYNLRN